MRILVAGVVALLLAACGGGESHVKTPAERLEEEMAAADEQIAAEEADSGRFKEATTDSEEATKFDDRGAEIELTRAARSAETCPSSLPPEQQKDIKKGVAVVTLTFQNDGHVKDAKIASEYQDTPVGACVLRAMGAVIVNAYTGEEKTLDWKVDLTGEKQAAEKKAAEDAKAAKEAEKKKK
jgi:hypothetical protein